MADAQEESLDSRTSVAGRKRDLQDSLQYRESVDADDSSDEGRSRKRFKGAHKHSNATCAGDDLPMTVSSHPPAQQPQQVDGDGLSKEEPGQAQTSQVVTQSVLELAEERSGGSSSAEVKNDALPATWNQGVQSGLRTSFGSKSRSRRALSKSFIPDQAENNRQSALPVAMQLDVSMQLDHFQALHDDFRGSADEGGTLMHGGKSPTSIHTVQVETVSALPPQIEALSNDNLSGGEESHARVSESLTHPEITEAQAEIRQSDLSSSEGNVSEGEESNSNGISRSVGPSTRSHSVSAHEKSTKLGKHARKRLSIPERQAYKEAFAADEAEKRQAKTAWQVRNTQKAANRLRNMRNGGKVKKLTQSQLDSLDPQERDEYLTFFKEAEANRAEKERRLLEEATDAATALLAEGCRPPFPGRHDIAEKIAQGCTFYPRDCKPIYQNRFGDFNVFEVLDQGKPIHVTQFSFNVFAPRFLTDNRDKWNVITQKTLVSAFSIYITGFYSHVLGYAEWLRSTATADNALTLEKAKLQVRLEGSEDANKLDGAMAANGDDAQSSNRGKTTSVPLLSSAEAIEDPEKASIGNLAVDPLRPSDATASLNLFDDSKVESWASKDSDHLGGIHINGRTSESERGQTPPNEDDKIMADAVGMEVTNLAGASIPLPEVESMDFDIDEAELLLQQKYFPSDKASTAPRCLSCGQVGHNNSTCPALSCTSCGSFGKHSAASCPLSVRCGKCRERGHSKQDCPEKLARSKGEAVACDMCGSKDHLEFACHYIWRSYEPKPAEIHRVRDIPVYCYSCGARDHYGPECGLHRGPILSGGNTWSKNNLLKYLDPTCQERALSAGVDYSIPARSNRQFSIKGKANDPIPVDDSDNEDFIRAKIKPPVQNGHIRFGHSNEDYLPRRTYENAPPRSHGPDNMQNALGAVSYYPAQPAQQADSYRLSGPPQGMRPLSMRGPNNGGGGKQGPNLKRAGPAEPGKRKRNKPTKADRARMQSEGKAHKRG